MHIDCRHGVHQFSRVLAGVFAVYELVCQVGRFWETVSKSAITRCDINTAVYIRASNPYNVLHTNPERQPFDPTPEDDGNHADGRIG